MRAAAAALLAVAEAALGASSPEEFHREVLALHERQVAGREVRTEVERADYEGAAAARFRYVGTRYYEASGRLLSHVRRDADRPEEVHIAEVNVYEGGRLVRDFGSITLPWAPRRPVRTFINLHHYAGGLHSFRQHDFSGEVGYESCEGERDGRRVSLSLDASDLNPTVRASADYRACFDGIDPDWRRYRTPH